MFVIESVGRRLTLVSGTSSEAPSLRTLTLLLRLLTNRQFAEELMNKVC